MIKISKEEYAARLALYERLMKAFPKIPRKGATMPYTSLNGHMFSFLAKDGRLSLRLPESERVAFLQQYDTELSKQYGSVMKEYVIVPDDMLHDLTALKAYFQCSIEYTASLKPKPSKKKKR